MMLAQSRTFTGTEIRRPSVRGKGPRPPNQRPPAGSPRHASIGQQTEDFEQERGYSRQHLVCRWAADLQSAHSPPQRNEPSMPRTVAARRLAAAVAVATV